MKKIVLGLLMIVIVAGCGGKGEPKEYSNGLLALKNKDYEKGVEFLTRVVELHPGSIYAAEAIYHMGLAYHRGLMDLERAEEYYRQYLSNFPDHAHKSEAEKGLVTCLYWQDRFEEALKIYQQLYESSPEEEWLPYQMVMCHYNLEQYDKCRQSAEGFIRQRPKASFVPSMIYRIANCYEKEENWLAASDSYKWLIKDFPLHKLRWSAKRDLTRITDKLPRPTPTAKTDTGQVGEPTKEQTVVAP